MNRSCRNSESAHTPDGRYFVVRGRLWRLSNPHLQPAEREALVAELMQARRAVRAARGDAARLAAARAAVDGAKQALGERGPVWWTDGAPDFNRRMAANTPYAAWHADLAIERAIVATLSGRSPLASVCPSEIARAMTPVESRWRALMPQILQVLVRLVDGRKVRVTRGTHTLTGGDFSGGPVRIRRGESFD